MQRTVKTDIYIAVSGPFAPHRKCGVQVFLPKAKILAEVEFISAEHFKKLTVSIKMTTPFGVVIFMERLMGVEPTYAAWEAAVLPMNYIRRCSFGAFP